MKAKVALFALSAVALASCSSNDMTDVNLGHAISFTTSVGRPSRAAENDKSAVEANGFRLYAFYNAGTEGAESTNFFGELAYADMTYAGNTWSYGTLKYWPEAGKISFYGLYPTTPASGTVAVTAASQAITGYTAGSEDLLYSVNADCTRPATASPINIQFKHALSQVLFLVKNTNAEGLEVVVKSVSLCNVANQGDFAWTGAWTNTNAGAAYATVTGANLTVTDAATYAGTTQSSSNSFIIPQDINPWIVDGKITANGAYIKVNCVVTDKTNGLELHNGDVCIPVATATTEGATVSNWQAGKRYFYTLIFGEGAGYKPGTEGEDPKPVLVPVKFSVDVDTFTDAGNINNNSTL